MIHVAVSGCTGFIGKKLCHLLKRYTHLHIIEIDRQSLTQLDLLLKTYNIQIFIHLVHDFRNSDNNILILDRLHNHFQKNYFPLKFIYLSSWVVLFDIGFSDGYYRSKLECEEYVMKNMKNYIILRPPLVCAKNNVWTSKWILWCSFGYYIHVNELSFLIYEYMNTDDICIAHNVKSHYFGKNIFNERFIRNIRFLPKTIGFFVQHIQFDKSSEQVSFQCLLYQKITSLEDVKWVAKYFQNDPYVMCGFQNSYILRQISLSNAFCMLDYNKVIEMNDTSITVQPGMPLNRMLEFMKSCGKTISHIPFFCEVSAAACLKTMIHGVSSTSSCVASCVIAFITISKTDAKTMTRWKGHDVHQITDNDIIISITFSIIPLTTVEIEVSTVDQYILDMDISEMEEYFYNNDAIHFVWNRTNKKTLITRYNKSSEEATHTTSPSIRRHIPYINGHYRKNMVFHYDEAFHEFKFMPLEKFFFRCMGRHFINVEIYFPFNKFLFVVDILQSRLVSIFSMMIRFTRTDHIISYPDTDIICWLDMMTSLHHAQQLIHDITHHAILAKIIRFHTGKYH